MATLQPPFPPPSRGRARVGGEARRAAPFTGRLRAARRGSSGGARSTGTRDGADRAAAPHARGPLCFRGVGPAFGSGAGAARAANCRRRPAVRYGSGAEGPARPALRRNRPAAPRGVAELECRKANGLLRVLSCSNGRSPGPTNSASRGPLVDSGFTSTAQLAAGSRSLAPHARKWSKVSSSAASGGM